MEVNDRSVTGSFRENGFTILKSCFDDDDLDQVLEETQDLICLQLAHLRQPLESTFSYDNLARNMATLLSCDLDRYLATVRLAAKLNSVRKLFFNENVAGFLQDFGHTLSIMQSEPVFHIMGAPLRIPNGYFGFEPHQDWTALQSSVDMVTIWIPLIDVDERNYPLELIPGSHRQGLAAGEEDEHIYQIDESVFEDDDFIPVRVSRGDAVLMSSFTIHRSGKSGEGDLVRMAVSHRYENGGEATYVERGYPFSQTKQIERKLFVPGFPTGKDLKAHYD